MLIVDIDMPKSCPCDLIGVGYAMWCSAASGIPKRVAEYDECVKNGTRPDWCPIIGVLPETHGDLIDRDELKKKKVYSHERHEYVVPVAYIDWEQAVIAAERKDDEQID